MNEQERAAMQQALEALEACDAALAEELAAWDIDPPLHHVLEASNSCGPSITALSAALAQPPEPVQEPVAWECKAGGLRRLTQRQYDAQPDNIKRHYTRIQPVQEPDYWQEEARRYAGNADYWRKRYEALAEPVEPVAKVELMTTGGNAGLATRIVEIDNHLRERLRPGQLLYTDPPQRKPLTDEEIESCLKVELARAVERKVRGEEK